MWFFLVLAMEKIQFLFFFFFFGYLQVIFIEYHVLFYLKWNIKEALKNCLNAYVTMAG